MPRLAELTRRHTQLHEPAVDHLERLVGSWGLLADLSFSDLLLFAQVGHPTAGEGAEQFLVLGQVRPTTGQTVYRNDYVGRLVTDHERPLVARTFSLGEIIDGEVPNEARRELIRELCIPVRLGSETVAVLSRESASSVGRQPGELEKVYVEVFHRFARMLTSGEFPFSHEEGWTDQLPRVGDGVLVLDGTARVEYASPNAVSALHRLGVHANTEGMRLIDLGLQETAVRTAFTRAIPATEEIELGHEVTVVLRCIPLLDQGRVTGAVLLLRDISELRRRDRLLLSKDATIREIHHRVKNNLQTISSLLRLQARRLSSPEAKAALEESVRRIRSIAIVHETLAHGAGEDVSFTDIVRPLVRMVEEGLVSPEHPVHMTIVGEAGELPAAMATSLAVVLTELLQNVVDHAYPPGLDSDAGHVRLELANDGEALDVLVVDDGAGLPEGFSSEATTGLGLSIVRTLVTTELDGTIEMRTGTGGGDRPGTVVALHLPIRVPEAG
ncbi:MAG: histidine kinase N-terminal domain-containing protein [Acidimicrobiales bacterium]